MSREIKLTQGQVAIIDDEDYEWLSQWKWYARKSRNIWYAVRQEWENGRQKQIHMHREILKPPIGMETDHRDRNGLNNQRNNLRIATRIQNTRNRKANQNGTSTFKGVFWNPAHDKWQAQIRVKRQRIHLGYFPCEMDAARTYDKAAKEYFGEFACINF